MKAKLLTLLCDATFWKYAVYSISSGGVVAAYFTDPRIQPLIISFSILLTKPISLGIAKAVIYMTPNPQSTDTKIDDIAHAVAEGILDASSK